MIVTTATIPSATTEPLTEEAISKLGEWVSKSWLHYHHQCDCGPVTSPQALTPVSAECGQKCLLYKVDGN